jgi:hypothetical protein
MYANVGLGQTIPWNCWDATGFKACHSAMWRAASDQCNTKAGKEVYEGDVSRCIEEQTYLKARDACFSLCPRESDQAVPVRMTEEEIEEAGGRPGRTNWKVIAGLGAVGLVGILLLSGVLMGRDYERKRAS